VPRVGTGSRDAVVERIAVAIALGFAFAGSRAGGIRLFAIGIDEYMLRV
jgi:hypothetical protein